MEISKSRLASQHVRYRNPRHSRARRIRRLIIALAAAAIFAGLVFAPAASAATGDFVISGRGNGQGQGMSQWGAWQGARSGKTYQEILAFYYPGTTLSTIAAVAPSRATITVRITTAVDTFTQVKLTAAATSATLLDSTGATISSLALGGSVTLLYSGGKVQVSGSAATYSYVDLKPDSDSGRVTVYPTPLWSSGGDRSYWGLIRVLPDSSSGQLYVHNILPIDKYVAGVAEIASDWAMPTSTSYYAMEAVKAQAVAARTYIAAHTSSVPFDDTRDVNYVGYDYEATLPGVTQAAQETAGVVLTYGGKVIATHFSGSSGGYTTNSAWSDTGQVAYEPAQPDPWSLTAPPTLPGYAWTKTVSPSTLASDLSSQLSVGTITRVDVIARDTSDPGSHARTLQVTGSTGTATISARTFKSLVGLQSTLILSIVKDGSLNRYEQTDSNLGYTGTWTATSATAASGGSFRYTDAAGSCTVSFNGTYLAWLAKKSTVYGKAKLTLDGVDQGTVDLYNATVIYGKVWETGTLAAGTHTLTIAWTGTKNSLATDYNISVDAFDVAGNLVPAPKLNHYEQTDSHLLYAGTWTATSATAASGGSFRYTDAAGSCTVSFNGTYLAWLGKKRLGLRQGQAHARRRGQRDVGPLQHERHLHEGLGHRRAAGRQPYTHHRLDRHEELFGHRLQRLGGRLRHPGDHHAGARRYPLPAGRGRVELRGHLGDLHHLGRFRWQLPPGQHERSVGDDHVQRHLSRLDSHQRHHPRQSAGISRRWNGQADQPRGLSRRVPAERVEHGHAFSGCAHRQDLVGSDQHRRQVHQRRRDRPGGDLQVGGQVERHAPSRWPDGVERM